jgi:hypothetical protein
MVNRDAELRKGGPAWANDGLDDQWVTELRTGEAGRLDDEELRSLVGADIEFFREKRWTDIAFGSQAWRALAMRVCAAQYEVLERLAERDEGNRSGEPSTALKAVLHEASAPEQAMVPLDKLFADYLASREKVNKHRAIRTRWKPVFTSLAKHLKHNNAARIAKKGLLCWRDALLHDLTPKTVSAVYLAAVRTVFQWAVENDRLSAPGGWHQPAPSLGRTAPQPAATS